jgi:nucleoside-diphosphate-sugar epimerase
MNILITGANGFVGSSLVKKLSNVPAVKLTMAARVPLPAKWGRSFKVNQLDSHTNWSEAVVGHHCVIHTAARTHVMKDEFSDSLMEYRRVNVHGTINLARQAAVAGIRRFIFISSIKVNGEQTSLGKPFMAQDIPAPKDAYGQSKLEAERGLLQIGTETGMEIVIIRPPLVYGLGVKGNFAALINIVQKVIPLPLGSIHNKRSLVSLDNLVDLIVTCINHPKAANEVFLAGDGQDLSTADLFRGVAKAAGVSSLLFPVPVSVLMFVASLLGKKAVAQRLLGSLQVDISKASDLLGWTPPISVEEGLSLCFIRKTERY